MVAEVTEATEVTEVVTVLTVVTVVIVVVVQGVVVTRNATTKKAASVTTTTTLTDRTMTIRGRARAARTVAKRLSTARLRNQSRIKSRLDPRSRHQSSKPSNPRTLGVRLSLT